MSQLSMALDEYKNRYGEYPPDLNDEAAVVRHLKRRWPRYRATYAQFLDEIALGCRLSSGDWARDASISNISDLTGQIVWEPGASISSLVFGVSLSTKIRSFSVFSQTSPWMWSSS